MSVLQPISAKDAKVLLNQMPPATEKKPLLGFWVKLRLRLLKVNYHTVEQMPKYKQVRLQKCIDFILDKYPDTETISLVMSQVDGYPIDEFTKAEDVAFLAETLDKKKFSDWDFIVPSITNLQEIYVIDAFTKVDMFKHHHRNVKQITVFNK